MLVPADDFEPFFRDDYVSTPILASMRAFPRTLGVIYVAYVSPGKGKSMACYAFLKKYAQGKAIAFSPPDGEQTYVDKILAQLKLDVNTGTGLVNALVDELHDGAGASKPSYVIFDDFMPNGPNHHDVQLLMQLKSRLRGKNVHCIVLTQNVDSANYALSRNKLASIQPLVDSAAFHDIINTVDVGKITEDFTIEWEKYCSMMWDDAAMKQAILLLPEYAKMSPEKKATVENAVDDYLQSDMLEHARYHLNIYSVLSMIQKRPMFLQHHQTIPPLLLGHPTRVAAAAASNHH
jgi:hypothetical protein